MNTRNIAVTLQCFVKKDTKYLMLYRNAKKKIMPNVWMAPGGHLEFNEGVYECARREIREETGLEIKNITIKAVGAIYMKDLNQEIFLHLVTADYVSGEVHDTEHDGKFAWLTPEEMSKLPNLLVELRHVLPYIFSNNEHTISYKAAYEKGNDIISFSLEEA